MTAVGFGSGAGIICRMAIDAPSDESVLQQLGLAANKIATTASEQSADLNARPDRETWGQAARLLADVQRAAEQLSRQTQTSSTPDNA